MKRTIVALCVATMTMLGTAMAAPLQIVVSGVVGGGPDVNARLLARHISKHLPDNQPAIVQNMNGGGGLVMMNWLYNVADKNNAIGNVSVNSNAMLNGMLGDPNARFDLHKFNWLFSTEDGQSNVFVLWANRTRGLNDVRQLLEPNNIYVIGNQDAGANNIQTVLVRDILGAQSKFVFGYKDIIKALVINEIDARVGTLISAKANNPDWLKEGNVIHPILQMGASKRHLDLPNVPLINEFASESDKPILAFFEQQVRLARLFAAPPLMDKERVEQLVNAARALEKDAEYIAEAKKLQIGVDYIHYEETNELVKALLNTPESILKRIKQ